jgi:hypothetical protein
MFNADGDFSEVSVRLAKKLLGEEVQLDDRPKMKKQNAKPLHELVSNAGEIEAVLQGTKLEWMIYEA